ncbi:MAG: hypothetical protein U0931_06455 [Vulcanimicrobiota bacterium]
MLELTVVTVLFTGLTAILTLAWTRGARGITYSDRITARLSQLNVVRHRLERELSQTHALSLQVRPTMLCFAVQPDDYIRRLNQWDRVCLYYYASAQLSRRELDLPLDHPLEYYAQSGKVVATQLTDFSLAVQENNVEFRLESGTVKLQSLTRVRN